MSGLLIVLGGLAVLANKKNETKSQNTTSAPISNNFDPLFKNYANLFGLDWILLKAICMKESTLGKHPKVARGLLVPTDVEGSKSEDGKSWGIMQITLPTGRDFDPAVTEVKLNNPEYSVRLAAQIIKWLYQRFEVSDPRRTEWVIKSYNQGVGNTGKEKRGEIDGYADLYFEKVMEFYKSIKASQ